MGTGINPKVDCVFKAIFGAEENKDVLIHLLNAVLTPEADSEICEVVILNPYNERTFEDGKQSIVDIKAKDQRDRSFQIEIQIKAHPGLRQRMIWTWADIYHRQLNKGQDYGKLSPTISIWFLDESLFAQEEQFHHDFGILERSNLKSLSDHFGLHVIEMQKWTSSLKGHSSLDAWLKFLNYGEDLDSNQLPEDLRIPVIQKAMSTLTRFTQSDEEHDLYMRRLEYLSLENTWKSTTEQALVEKAQAEQKAAEAVILAAEAEEKASQAELEREAEKAKAAQAELEREAEKAKAVQAELEREAEKAKAEKFRQALLDAGIDPDQFQ